MKHAFLKLCFTLAHHLLAYLCKYVRKDEKLRYWLQNFIDCSQCNLAEGPCDSGTKEDCHDKQSDSKQA